MGQFTTSKSFVMPAKATASSAQTGFLGSNALDYTHPNRPWKTTAISTSENLVLDLGVSTTFVAVVLDNVNVTSIKVQANATDSWATPSYTTTVTVGQDLRDGRRKAYVSTGSQSYRYVRILCNVSASSDGQAAFQVGAVMILSAVTSWDSNAGYPYEWTPIQAAAAHEDFTGGGREPAVLGNRYGQLGLTAPVLPTSAETDYLTILGYGIHQPFVFYRDNGDTSEVYLCRRVGQSTLAWSGVNMLSLSKLILEEAA